MSVVSIETDSINPDANYDMSRDEVERLTGELLVQRPPAGDDRFVCYMLHGSDRYANIGRHVESTVFNEAFHNNSEEMRREYGPYEEQSTFFISVDREKRAPTGALRIIENGHAGLKSLNDFIALNPTLSVENIQTHHGITDLDECWDIGTVAVTPENRSAEGGVSVQLYRGMYIAALEANIRHLVSIIDDRPFSKLTDYLGIPFKPLVDSKPFEYFGSQKSHAVYGYVPEFYDKMNKGRSWRLKKILARRVLDRLVDGTQDSEFQFESRYKN